MFKVGDEVKYIRKPSRRNDFFVIGKTYKINQIREDCNFTNNIISVQGEQNWWHEKDCFELAKPRIPLTYGRCLEILNAKK